MRIYIAGKITGDPNYKEKFDSAEKVVAELGHSVMNPAWLVAYPDFSYADYIAVSTTMQLRCNAILMLEDWRESNGAIDEFERAKKLGQEIFFDIDKIPRMR
jgi:hypothetical protein